MRTFAVLLVLVLVGCQSTPEPQTRTQYRLGPVGDANAQAPGVQVRVAPYLNQPGIIVEDAVGGLHPARYHQWSEPLGSAIAQLIDAELAQTVGRRVNGPEVRIFIERLHGTMQGRALLSATFAIGPEKSSPSRQFSSSAALGQAGYPALVDAEESLIRQLAAEIAKSLTAAGLEAGGS